MKDHDGQILDACEGYGKVRRGAAEHLATERCLQSSGLNYSLLRNGWYYENQTAAILQAIKNGAFIGASGDGRFAAASRPTMLLLPPRY